MTTDDPLIHVEKDIPVLRADVLKLTDDELETLIANKREKRLRLQREWEEAELAKRNIEASKKKTQLEKQLEMLRKDIDAIDTRIDKTELRMIKIRALRMELGDMGALSNG